MSFRSKVVSWFLSPVLSGIMSAILFYFVRKFILNKVSPTLLSHWPVYMVDTCYMKSSLVGI